MCRHFGASGDLYRRKWAMISQDEEREGALYVRQKEDDNDAKNMEGGLLDFQGWSRGGRAERQVRQRGRTGMTKDERSYILFREIGGTVRGSKGAFTWRGWTRQGTGRGRWLELRVERDPSTVN